MSISRVFATGSATLSPRLGALALSAVLAGAASAPALANDVGPTRPPLEKDYHFSFSAELSDGFISGSGVLVTGPLASLPNYLVPPGARQVTTIKGGTATYTPDAPGSSASDYNLTLIPVDTYPTPSGVPALSNDNIYVPKGNSQLDNYGISFAVGALGDINIADGSYNFTSTFAGNGTGNLQTSPGPTPGTGLLALTFLMLAGAVARARGFLAR
jgi:hypothetical protein